MMFAWPFKTFFRCRGGIMDARISENLVQGWSQCNRDELETAFTWFVKLNNYHCLLVESPNVTWRGGSG